MAHILIIDDEDMVRLTLRKILEQAGHSVTEAADGNLGLEAFKARPPDLVITDIIMPGKEGIETIIEIKRENPDMKIIAISGGGRIGNLDFLAVAGQLGANEVLSKPFQRNDVVTLIDKCLGNEAVKTQPAAEK